MSFAFGLARGFVFRVKLGFFEVVVKKAGSVEGFFKDISDDVHEKDEEETSSDHP